MGFAEPVRSRASERRSNDYKRDNVRLRQRVASLRPQSGTPRAPSQEHVVCCGDRGSGGGARGGVTS